MKIEHPGDEYVPGLKGLWKEAFGDSDTFIDTFFQTAFAPERCLCMTDDGTVAAAAYWFDCAYTAGKSAYIYAVATANVYRGRGCCRALMDAIGRLLADRGYVCAILVPGDAALSRMYAGMGYQFFGGMTMLQVQAKGCATAVTEISPMEYARARREMLPPGGIVQEGENLAFLEQHFHFYRGDHFLMAAATDKNSLFAPEYLGDPSQTAGILTALGTEKGAFRLPGADRFAMCRMLRCKEKPGYFGFAFD